MAHTFRANNIEIKMVMLCVLSFTVSSNKTNPAGASRDKGMSKQSALAGVTSTSYERLQAHNDTVNLTDYVKPASFGGWEDSIVMSDQNMPKFYIRLSDCVDGYVTEISGTYGEIVGLIYDRENVTNGPENVMEGQIYMTRKTENTTSDQGNMMNCPEHGISDRKENRGNMIQPEHVISNRDDLTKDGPYVADDHAGGKRSPVKITCKWMINGLENMHLSARFNHVTDPCLRPNLNITLDSTRTFMNCYSPYTMALFATANTLAFTLSDNISEDGQLPMFKIRFQSTTISFQRVFTVIYSSESVGYLTTSGFRGFVGRTKIYSEDLDAVYELTAPVHCGIMISFPQFDVNPHRDKAIRFRLFAIKDDGAVQSIWSNTYNPSTRFLDSHVIKLEFQYRSDVPYWGFKMLFSFLPKTYIRRTSCNICGSKQEFFCAVPYYNTSYAYHLECNFYPECHNKADEGDHCAYTTRGCAGLTTGYRNKCYMLVELGFPKRVFPNEADETCRKPPVNGRLATMKTRGEWERFLDQFQYGRASSARGTSIGLKTADQTMPDIYRKAFLWFDNTVTYEMNVTYFDTGYSYEDSATVVYEYNIVIYPVSKHEPLEYYMCEGTSKTNFSNGYEIIQLHKGVQFTRQVPAFFYCPPGHMTHDFLSCSRESDCGVNYIIFSCPLLNNPLDTDNNVSGVSLSHNISMGMFECENNQGTTHYTLVCDFRADCPDGSDEDFCQHEHCEGFTCSNGQCIAREKECDFVRNCADGSDEGTRCERNTINGRYIRRNRLPPPALVDFQYGGDFTQTPMKASDACPETHFRCPGESSYCLPVFVRCNGVYDCAGREDEVHCDRYACPGFYRCRASRVCVHGDHLCDGLPHCPKHDDELFCGSIPCPDGCRCQGLAFVCRRPFPAHSFPYLRYLDARMSNVTIDLSENRYLVWLNQSGCRLTHYPPLNLPNLQILHLENNFLPFVTIENLQNLRILNLANNMLHFLPSANMTHLHILNLENNLISSLELAMFENFSHLRNLTLAGNPLVTIREGNVHIKQINLLAVDLSHTYLHVFDGSMFSGFSHIRFLNLSHSSLTVIVNDNFSFLPRLSEVDLRGCPLREFQVNIFKASGDLSFLYVSDYKLCCKHVLPENFDEQNCFGPENEVASCEHLIKSDIYRWLAWTLGIVAVCGNGASLVWLSLFRGRIPFSDLPPFVSVGLQSLNIADLLMGVSMTIVVVADSAYRGLYVLYHTQWTYSIACRAAGFLSLLSCEVAAFTLCVITLDRAVALCMRSEKQNNTQNGSENNTFRYCSMSSSGCCSMSSSWCCSMGSSGCCSVSSSWWCSLSNSKECPTNCCKDCFMVSTSSDSPSSSGFSMSSCKCCSTNKSSKSSPKRFSIISSVFYSAGCSTLSVILVYSAAWIISILIAALPLLPVMSPWDIYSSSGLCSPLPSTSIITANNKYYPHLIINLVVYVLVGLGQACVSCQLRTASITIDSKVSSHNAVTSKSSATPNDVITSNTITSNKVATSNNAVTPNIMATSKELLIAHRFVTVVTSNVACWLVICCISLLKMSDVHVSPELSVFVSLCLMPINSALNPLLYALSVRAERQRQEARDKLLLMLSSRVATKRKEKLPHIQVPESYACVSRLHSA